MQYATPRRPFPGARRLALLMALSLALLAPASVLAQGGAAGQGAQAEERQQGGDVRVTKPPRLIKDVKAEYTEEAVEARVEGTVKLRLSLSATGEVTDVEVLEGLGYGLDQAAVEAARQFEFEPAEINGQPAPVAFTFNVQFSLPTLPATFRGKAVSADDGQPLEAAKVSIAYTGQEYEPAPSASTLTDAQGSFSFENVPPGPYAITVEATGFEDRQAVVDLASGETVEVTYRFSKSPENLVGTVLEAGTRKPLSGVEVNLVDPETDTLLREVFTGAQGRFSFRGLEPGQYLVVLEAAGYNAYESVETVRAAEITRPTYYLEAEYYDPYSVETRAQQEKREVSRERIQLEELRRIPGTGGDVVRVVQNMPGVARAPYVAGQIIVRGASPQDTKVFLQGDVIPLVYHFLGGPAIVNSEMIESIDFYPGNFSVYYGRATGGVIALNTRKPRDDRFHGMAEVDLLDATVMVEGPITEELSFAVSARRSYIDALLPAVVPEDEFELTVAPKYYDYQGWLNWEPSDEHRLEFFVYGSHDELAVLLDDDEPQGGTNVQITGVDLSNAFHRGQIRWEWRPQNDIESDFIASFGLNTASFSAAENLYFEADYYQSQIREDLTFDMGETFDLRLGADFQFGNTVYDFRFPPQERGDRGGGGPPTAAGGLLATGELPLMQPAFYVEGIWEPTDRWQIIPGVRWDYYGDVGELSTSPRLATRYRVADPVTLKGGVGLFTQPLIPGYTEPTFGNPDLTFEKAIHYSAGVEWSILDYLELDATLFYRDMYDLAVDTDDVERSEDAEGDDVALLTFNNDGEGRAYGLEFLLRHYPQDRFFGWLAYTLSRSERLDPQSGDYEAFRYDQTHILTLVAGYNLPWNIDISGRFRLVTGNPYTPVAGGVFNADDDRYEQVSGPTNSARRATFHQLDLRIDKKFIYDTWILGIYLDVLNVYWAENPEGTRYNYDYTESGPVPGLPILPLLGISAKF